MDSLLVHDFLVADVHFSDMEGTDKDLEYCSKDCVFR